MSTNPTKIAIIGANGQVGSEACLFLRLLPDIEVVPISRSVHGSSLLRRCGFECRHGSFDSDQAAKDLIGDCDVVVDFSLPGGTVPQMRATIDRMIASAMRGGERLQHYIYMSTKAVYRLQPSQPFYRRYGSIKSYAEKTAFRLGREHGRQVTAFRLGEVHGELQSVTRKSLREMRPGAVSVPAGSSNNVFVFSIAEAIDLVRKGKVPPSTYTLIANPAWTWSEIHQYYADRVKVPVIIRTHPAPHRAIEFFSLRNLFGAVRREIAAQAYANRDFIDDQLVNLSPEKSIKLRAENARRRTLRAIAEDPGQRIWKPYPEEFTAPGERLEGLSDSRITMAGPAAEVRGALELSAADLR